MARFEPSRVLLLVRLQGYLLDHRGGRPGLLMTKKRHVNTTVLIDNRSHAQDGELLLGFFRLPRLLLTRMTPVAAIQYDGTVGLYPCVAYAKRNDLPMVSRAPAVNLCSRMLMRLASEMTQEAPRETWISARTSS